MKKTPKKQHKEDNDKVIAIIGLVINVFALPGLGSIIGGRTNTGIAQLIMFLIGIPLSLIIVGIPLVIAAWVWGLVTGLQMIREK